MAKGFDSSEREIRERSKLTQICEAYACSELAHAQVGRAYYCAEHTPPSSLTAPAQASAPPVQD